MVYWVITLYFIGAPSSIGGGWNGIAQEIRFTTQEKCKAAEELLTKLQREGKIQILSSRCWQAFETKK